MSRFEVRWLRLAVVAGAIAGSALVSSAVVAADEAPPIDEPIVVETPSDFPLDDIAVIEIVMVESDVTGPGASGADPTEAPLPDAASEAAAGEEPPEEPVTDLIAVEPDAGVLLAEPDAKSLLVEPDAELRSATVAAAFEHIEVETAPDGNEPTSEVDHGDHEGEGGQGESGGRGTPYLVTFEVVWYPDVTLIDALDRSSFELTADSQTGKGKPTSATCIYTAGSEELQCEFINKGHGSESDGLIVPASKKATYTVDVVWSPMDWTIDGADDVAYSCRTDVGGDDHGEGGDDHGDGGDDHGDGGDDHGDLGDDHGKSGGGGHEAGGGGKRSTVPCVHRVTMRQIVVPRTEPPVVVPVPEAPAPAVPEAIAPVVPEATPPVVPPTEVVEEAAPVAVASRSALPATGSSISVLLVLAGLLVVAGSTLAVFSRRTSSAGS